jgi:hypothetical protein
MLAEYMMIVDITDTYLEADYLIPLLKYMKQGKKIKAKTWLRKLENIFSRSSASIIKDAASVKEMLDGMYKLTIEGYVLKDFTVRGGTVDENNDRIDSRQISDLNIIEELSDLEMRYLNLSQKENDINNQKIEEIEKRFVEIYDQLQLDRYIAIGKCIRDRIIQDKIKQFHKIKVEHPSS